MAHKVRRSAYETFNTRKRIAVRKKPYVAVRLGSGLILLYRRNAGNGAWIVKAAVGDGKNYWTKAFAHADDFTEAGTTLPDGTEVLNFFAAQTRARELTRKDADDIATGAPATLDDALKRYKASLEARGSGLTNETSLRRHLTPTLLAKPVAMLTGDELTAWRDGLVAKGLKASTANRYMGPLRAALNAAAKRDPRIKKNESAWSDHLENLPDASNARKLFLEPAKICAYVAAAYDRSAHFGEFFEVLATSGARASQPARLLVRDLQAGSSPRLLMPKSGKGGSRDRAARKEQRYSVPIPPALAKRLATRARGKAPDDLLLTQPNGTPYCACWTYRDDVAAVAAAMNDPDFTLYVLRHSSIISMLLKGASPGFVAKLHDTSTQAIEANYAHYITEFADEHARALMPDLSGPPRAGNVVALER
jgi:hypothetical protein